MVVDTLEQSHTFRIARDDLDHLIGTITLDSVLEQSIYVAERHLFLFVWCFRLKKVKFFLGSRKIVVGEMWSEKCGRRNVVGELWSENCGRKIVVGEVSRKKI